MGSRKITKLVALFLLGLKSKSDTCTSKPTPYIVGASDGDTSFSCAAIVDTQYLYVGGTTSSAILTSASLTPILFIFDLNGNLLTPYKSFKIVM